MITQVNNLLCQRPSENQYRFTLEEEQRKAQINPDPETRKILQTVFYAGDTYYECQYVLGGEMSVTTATKNSGQRGKTGRYFDTVSISDGQEHPYVDFEGPNAIARSTP